jgi:hypothetical protein
MNETRYESWRENSLKHHKKKCNPFDESHNYSKDIDTIAQFGNANIWLLNTFLIPWERF